MNSWNFIKTAKRLPLIKESVLLEGMPGIGNVGKVAADFMIEELEAEKLYDVFSYHLPNSVFINEENLAEMPSISVYHKKMSKGPDLLFLVGDVQPIDEVSTYTFCEAVLDLAQKHKVREIITLGGIGLSEEPAAPKLYCTGNDRKAIDVFAKYKGVDPKLHGIVGPIMGVTGLLLGLAQHRKIPAVALLAETLGHPMYLGIKGSREIARVLSTHLHLGIDMHEMDKEINRIEDEISSRSKALEAGAPKEPQEASYIG